MQKAIVAFGVIFGLSLFYMLSDHSPGPVTRTLNIAGVAVGGIGLAVCAIVSLRRR
jgi:hypothetical protein